MDQLTGFERALLAQFESLEAACDTSLKSSGDTAKALLEFSEHIGKRVRRLEAQQEALATVLNARTQETQALVDAVNRLLDEQKY